MNHETGAVQLEVEVEVGEEVNLDRCHIRVKDGSSFEDKNDVYDDGYHAGHEYFISSSVRQFVLDHTKDGFTPFYIISPNDVGIIDGCIRRLSITTNNKTNQPTKELIKERGKIYGDAATNFSCEGALKQVFAEYAEDTAYTPHNIAIYHVLSKLARIITGKYHKDNYDDIKGYAELAKQLGEEDE